MVDDTSELPDRYSEFANGRELETLGETVSAVAAFSDKPTANGHIYPRAELEKLAAQMSTKIARGQGFVFMRPGMSPVTEERMQHVAARMTECLVDERGRLRITAVLLKTTHGMVVRDIVERAPERLALSMSTTGALGEDGTVADACGPIISVIDRRML